MLIGLASLKESLLDPAEAVLSQLHGVDIYQSLMACYEDDISDNPIKIVSRVWEGEANSIRQEGGVVVHLCDNYRDLLCSVLPVHVKVNDYTISTQPIDTLHIRLTGLLTTIQEDLHGADDRPAA